MKEENYIFSYLSKHSGRLISWAIFVVPKNPYSIVAFIGTILPEFTSLWIFVFFLKLNAPQNNPQIYSKIVFIMDFSFRQHFFVEILWLIFNNPKKYNSTHKIEVVKIVYLHMNRIIFLFLWQTHSTDLQNATLQIHSTFPEKYKWS